MLQEDDAEIWKQAAEKPKEGKMTFFSALF
jgi:hypothetical protein